MPRTRTLEVGGEDVAREKTMASGKVVRDIIGWRKTVSASWEWLPADTLAEVVALARQCGFVTIEYPDVVNGTVSAKFSIKIGNQKVFKFRNGNPYWYNVELSATAQEVE